MYFGKFMDWLKGELQTLDKVFHPPVLGTFQCKHSWDGRGEYTGRIIKATTIGEYNRLMKVPDIILRKDMR